MKKSSRIVLLLVVLSFFVTAQQKPVAKTPAKTSEKIQEQPSGKFIGAVITDFTYVVQEPKSAASPNTTVSGRNSFDTRRVHIGYEQAFNKEFSARIIYDPAVGSLQEAYLQWNELLPMHSLTVGMMHTVAERTAEKYFGYRSLGPLVLDKKGYSQEFDRGISLLGKFDPQGSIYYTLSASNGSGTALETDKIKKGMLTFGLMPDKESVMELYVDMEHSDSSRAQLTGKILYALTQQSFAFGAEFFYRMFQRGIDNSGATKDITPAGGSLFGWVQLDRSLRTVFRADIIDADLNNAGALAANPSYRQIALNLGLDYFPHNDIHIIPNLLYTKELIKDKGTEIADIISVRLTTAVYFR